MASSTIVLLFTSKFGNCINLLFGYPFGKISAGISLWRYSTLIWLLKIFSCINFCLMSMCLLHFFSQLYSYFIVTKYCDAALLHQVILPKVVSTTFLLVYAGLLTWILPQLLIMRWSFCIPCNNSTVHRKEISIGARDSFLNQNHKSQSIDGCFLHKLVQALWCCSSKNHP